MPNRSKKGVSAACYDDENRHAREMLTNLTKTTAEKGTRERDLPAPLEAPANLLGMPFAELQALVQRLGQPAYRARQIHEALYVKHIFDFEKMTVLPAEFRAGLSRAARIELPAILRRHTSRDGSARYVFALAAQDGDAPSANVETVFMPEANRQTICISTQAGCAVNCRFCLTATLGLIRNLSAGEILGQALVALDENREKLKPRTNMVLMGQGEPLLNYEAVMQAMRILLDSRGMGISPRHATLSTSGIIPGIERLGKEPVRPKLAISLNASSDAQRSEIMPINRKYPLGELLDACRKYPLRSWEKLTFEYVLLGGFNDAPEDARRVAKLLSGLRAKVNVIPWNPGELPYEPPRQERIEAFREILTSKGVPAFVRYSRGQDVMAACGQLALIESAMGNTSANPTV